MTFPPWLYALVAFVLTLLFTPVAIFYSKKMQLLDHPEARRSHQNIVPRGGGAVAVAVLLLLCLTLLFYQSRLLDTTAYASILAFTLAVFLLGLAGYMDDHAVLSNRYKLLLQLLACAVALLTLGLAEPSSSTAGGMLVLAAFFAMVWLTNLYNFMDGSHGLAAGQAVFSGLLFAWVFSSSGVESLAILALMLAGVSAGFLFWNFPRPRAFMGDVLSGVLGVAFSVLIVAGWLVYQLDLVLLCIVLSLFVVDASLTLLARILTGQKWYNPHRQHAYQRLVAGQFGHTRTWMVYQCLNVLIVLPAVWLAQTGRMNSTWVAVVVYLLFSMLWYAVYKNQSNNNKNIKIGH